VQAIHGSCETEANGSAAAVLRVVPDHPGSLVDEAGLIPETIVLRGEEKRLYGLMRQQERSQGDG